MSAMSFTLEMSSSAYGSAELYGSRYGKHELTVNCRGPTQLPDGMVNSTSFVASST
eukprot:CAMPEP_0174871850 /NCGR_PEP_ID=MMETSP1114-20130205/72254_1 /TAXON_ID=312471 /ORGANISM="Neobodo designis, Strain CCAP 1951/1" /LENGTH=55 /DNA_ID=CAMNT_0016107141 /DNA_START=13 /DNA_END=176 /DNA_ORIENTATION=-